MAFKFIWAKAASSSFTKVVTVKKFGTDEMVKGNISQGLVMNITNYNGMRILTEVKVT